MHAQTPRESPPAQADLPAGERAVHSVVPVLVEERFKLVTRRLQVGEDDQAFAAAIHALDRSPRDIQLAFQDGHAESQHAAGAADHLTRDSIARIEAHDARRAAQLRAGEDQAAQAIPGNGSLRALPFKGDLLRLDLENAPVQYEDLRAARHYRDVGHMIFGRLGAGLIVPESQEFGHLLLCRGGRGQHADNADLRQLQPAFLPFPEPEGEAVLISGRYFARED